DVLCFDCEHVAGRASCKTTGAAWMESRVSVGQPHHSVAVDHQERLRVEAGEVEDPDFVVRKAVDAVCGSRGCWAIHAKNPGATATSGQATESSVFADPEHLTPPGRRDTEPTARVERNRSRRQNRRGPCRSSSRRPAAFTVAGDRADTSVRRHLAN